MDMRFNEFVEAFSRVADKAVHHSLVEFPTKDNTQKQQNKSKDRSMTRGPSMAA